MTKILLIKTTPNKISKTKTLIKKEKDILIISLTKYLQWKLKQNGIESRLFNALAKTKDIESLHSLLSKQYGRLCTPFDRKQKLNYSDLLKNHLCWEIQNAYYFIATLEKWLRKYAIRKVYFESLPLIKKKKYAEDINYLIRKYHADKKITFEEI
ncbi:MAG: hypothetical protein KBB01_01195 [Candidatus Omnitrophica bacterium]|jgi:hypothetical protein|nr:hypothetical protein [Candidatus Omnitrophota bacterium]